VNINHTYGNDDPKDIHERKKPKIEDEGVDEICSSYMNVDYINCT
jgi:hypothetical protein